MIREKIACFPEIGDYYIVVNLLLERCLNYKTIICPPTTRRTVEIGSRNSPDMICTPFKVTLGNLIEALEAGANVLVMPGAGCRLGFYDLLQKQILSDLGYEFEMLPLFDYIPSAERLFKNFKEINPDLTQDNFNKIFALVIRVTKDMDSLNDFLRKNMAFEMAKGECRRQYQAYLKKIQNASDLDEAETLGKKYRELLQTVEINKPDNPIRIGIIGEMYDVMEPFANCELEKWLTDHGVEIDCTVNLTNIATALFTVPEQIAKSGGYATYNIGSTANDSLARAYEMVNNGIDGIIHIKPASCSPETTLMMILQNLSRDYQTPILYLTFDTETSEAGLHTRLEAFHDMIVMKGSRQ